MEQRIWCDIDLETVPDYEVWKPESSAWALSIDGQQVNTLVRDHLDQLPADLSGRWLSHSVHWNHLPSLQREGLASLYAEPIVATNAQASSGGHRERHAPARCPVGTRPVPTQRRRRQRRRLSRLPD